MVKCFFPREQYDAVVALLEDRSAVVYAEGTISENVITGAVESVKSERYRVLQPISHSDLDALFAEAAAEVPEVSDRLMAALMADAARLQPGALRPRVPVRGGFLAGLADLFGGRGALAGMTLATVAGLYLGIAQPAALVSLTASIYSETPLDSLDLMSGSDSLWSEQ